MMVRILLVGVLCLVLNATAFAGGGSNGDGKDDVITKIVLKSLGQKINIIRIEKPEKSRLNGFQQVRVWIESVYGETPILFYKSDDGKFYLAGTIYDPAGKNLTQEDVGKTKPKVVKESEMSLDDDYRIGPKDAKVRVVLWLGADSLSKGLFNTYYDLYGTNKDKMALYIKFYPAVEKDYRKLNLLTCAKGEEATELYKTLLDQAPDWGSNEDVETFKEKHGLKDRECKKDAIKNDMAISKKLNLPLHPVVFVNGTMLIGEQNKESISKLAGVELY